MRRPVPSRQPRNAPVHKSCVPITVIHNAGCEFFQQPTYSPDLAPSDYFLFLKLKERLRGTHSSDDEEVTTSVNEGLTQQDKYFFLVKSLQLLSINMLN
jgi:hypothetical protein